MVVFLQMGSGMPLYRHAQSTAIKENIMAINLPPQETVRNESAMKKEIAVTLIFNCKLKAAIQFLFQIVN